MNKNKKLPEFENEEEEREFWAEHDFSDYLNQFAPVKLDLSELKPSSKPITVRMPEILLGQLKKLAHKRDVPYQSLLKVLLAKQMKKEISG